jgi:hypothetical protein
MILPKRADPVANQSETIMMLTDKPEDDERAVIMDGLRPTTRRRREFGMDVHSPFSRR